MAVGVDIEDCDWMLEDPKGSCGVFSPMYRQVGLGSGKITALFLKAHLTAEGHLCLSQEQSACPPATKNSFHHKIRSGLITTCFLFFYALSNEAEMPTDQILKALCRSCL